MTSSDVWAERSRINFERDEKMREAMDKYDREVYKPAIQALHQKCGKETGHNYKFDRLNQFGNPIYKCLYCGQGQVVSSNKRKAS